MADYTITFMPLRAEAGSYPYVVSIGSGSGNVPLKGGAQPFVTQESDNDDMFTPIRTQSGYLRIVDDGLDANGNAFNWKNLIPATDTAMPVTLTRGGVVLWRGFMQAQDFGSVLYGNPQEREFPIQCVLTVTQGTDINYQQTAIQNFAYLLKQIVDSIPVAQRPTEFYIQGGADAQAWLLKKIDWQNFVSEDGDGNTIAKYSMYECLEDMCTFWGWTARTKGTALYLTCADDSAEINWLHLTYSNLATMAGGTAAGTTTDTFLTSNLDQIGDIFASVDNNEYVQRGHNKAIVNAETNRADDDIFNIFNNATVDEMKSLGFQSGTTHGMKYTNDMLSVNRNFWNISCRQDYASLNIGLPVGTDNNQYINVIRFKKTGGNNVTPFVQMETVYEHNFSSGFLMFFGKTYRFAEEYQDPLEHFFLSRSFMFAKIGIGSTRSNASWWNGRTWQSSETFCRISIGNKPNHIDDNKNEYTFLYLQAAQASDEDWATNILPITNLYGKLFIDFLGTSDSRVSEIDGERSFELNDLRITFQRNAGVEKSQFPSDMWSVEAKDRPTSFSYIARNQNNVRNEWNADCIYATENACKYCYGQIFDPSGSLISEVTYGQNSERPEQHLADRVRDYWQTSKRRIEAELRSDRIPVISPRHKVTIDGMTGYPIAISHEWRDDVTQLTILQL